MVAYSQIVGKQEDWASVVTDVEMIETPFVAWLPVGKAPVQAERLYQADVYEAPVENTHPDGKNVTGFKSAGRNRKSLRSVIQYSTKAAEVSKLTQEAGNNAAIADELGREIARQTKEFSKDVEGACLSVQECRVGDTVNGYRTRGVPQWILRSAQATYPVDSTLYPDAAQVDATASGSITEDVVLNVLQGIGIKTRSNQTVTLFAGPSLKRLINSMPMFLPAQVPVGGTTNAGANPRSLRGVYDRVIESYKSDFCPVDIILSYNMDILNATASGPAAAANSYRNYWGYFLHQDRWELAWHTKPEWHRKEYEGGLYQAFMESIFMLTCWNPAGEAAMKAAS